MSHPVFPICQKLILFFRFFSQTPHFCHMSRPRFCHMSEINSFFSSKAHFPRRTHRPSHTSHARPILSVSLPLSLSTRQVTQARVDRRRRHYPPGPPRVSGKRNSENGPLFPHLSDPLFAISQDLIHPKKKKNQKNPQQPFFPYVATPFLPYVKR